MITDINRYQQYITDNWYQQVVRYMIKYLQMTMVKCLQISDNNVKILTDTIQLR